jgi:UDP-N-acetylmuramate--alanine ligase
MPKINLKKIKKVHLIGIGGIGVSSLARILHWQGKKISGSDLTPSKVTHDLEKMGLKIFIGKHKAENIKKDIDLVVHTTAAEPRNPELLQAKKYKIQTATYPELLGELSHNKFTICIAGTHGKTTTTSMVSLILEKAGFDPTCIIGSYLEAFKGNARLGKSKYFVLEADEYKAAFLNYHPNIIILTTLEYEHPDYYKNLNDVIFTFKKFIEKLPKDGILIANADDKNVMLVTQKAPCKVITYGIKASKSDILGTNINFIKGLPRFNAKWNKNVIKSIKLKIPGIHNVSNALAATALGLKLKIKPEIIKKTLQSFLGAWRRFELKGKIAGITIIDDYAHHPTEVKVTLTACRQRFPKQKIICIFQPHHKKRFQELFNDFVKSFDCADEIIIPDIYEVAGREKEEIKLSSKDLVLKLKEHKKQAKYIPTLQGIVKYLAKKVERNDIVITMGAGDVTTVGNKLIYKLQTKRVF